MAKKKAKKQPTKRDDALNPGETGRYECQVCLTEFEVCLEPKASGLEDTSFLESKSVELCPFCGGTTERIL